MGGELLGSLDFGLSGNASDNRLFGNSGANTLSGLDGADTLSGMAGYDTLVGGANDDRYFLEDLIPGDGVVLARYDDVVEAEYGGVDTVFVRGLPNLDTFSPGYTLTMYVENATLLNDFDFYLEGNYLANVLTARGGQNTLWGWDGNDTLVGGIGGDALMGGEGFDTADYSTSAGAVNVFLNAPQITNGGDAEGDTFDSIESLIGSQFGDILSAQTNVAGIMHGLAGNDYLSGSSLSDTLYGGLDNDILNGFAGADILDGESGSDTATYEFALAGVTADLQSPGLNAGWAAGDTYNSIENLGGTEYGDTLRGNAGVNVLSGWGGNDILDGRGGNDTMYGGFGDDQFYVDHAGDVVNETAGEGAQDRVFATLSYVVTASAQIEIISTTNHAGTAAINLTGNAFGQTLQGNAGANVLDGKGGADAMVGRGGNDWFYVDHAGDTVNDGAGEGTADRVFASASYALNGGAQIETISTIDAAGTTAINLTGNEFAQALQGNAGANRLDGRGGADAMVGRGGDDWFYVDNAGDTVNDGVGEGTADRVLASTTYTLGAAAKIEFLTTTTTAGTTAINLTGNALAQTIQGNNGANILNGGGGNDTLQGFAGADIYLFNTALNAATNVDTIVGYSIAQNVIQLENAVFAGLANGALAAGAFRTGASALDADDRILYNAATGALIFDSNGNAAGGATQFATLAVGLAMANAEFIVV